MNTSTSLPSGDQAVHSVRRNTNRLALLVPLLSLGLMLCPTNKAQAADGTWTNTSGGTWSTPGNWSGTIVADGSTSSAFFDSLDLNGATPVELDSARSIGTMVFGDTSTATAGSWVLGNNGNAANILTLGGAATITVNAMSSVTNTSSNVTINAIIDGTNGLTKNGTGTNSTATNNTTGTGTLTLAGANTYTGATNINSGTIRATNSLAFGGVAGGKLTTNVVNVASGARLMLSNVNIANTVNLNGSNAVTVTGGNSTLSGTVNLQSNSSAYVHNGGNYTLTFSNAVNLGNNVFSLFTTGNNNGMTISGTLTGGLTSGITKSGSGPLILSGDSSGYSGTTTLNGGEIRLGVNNATGTAAGTLTISPGNNSVTTIRSSDATARTVASKITIGSGISARYAFGSANATGNGDLRFTNTTPISLSAGQKLFEVANRTQFDAGFTGTGGITKQDTGGNGAGTLVLNGINTYSGNTTINAGTLELTADGGLRFVIGANGVNNQINGTGTVSLDGEFTFDLSSASTTLGDSWLIVDVGTLTETFGSNFNVASFTESANLWTGTANGASYQFSETTGILQVIPEPSAAAMLLGGFALLIGFQRSRRPELRSAA